MVGFVPDDGSETNERTLSKLKTLVLLVRTLALVNGGYACHDLLVYS